GLAIGTLVGLLWLEHRSGVTLPPPTGSFGVGREIHDWADSVTLDTLAPVRGTKRELLVWIGYPAAAQSGVADDYLPAQLRPKADPSGGANIWTLLTRDVSNVRGPSGRGAQRSPQQQSHTVA